MLIIIPLCCVSSFVADVSLRIRQIEGKPTQSIFTTISVRDTGNFSICRRF